MSLDHAGANLIGRNLFSRQTQLEFYIRKGQIRPFARYNESFPVSHLIMTHNEWQSLADVVFNWNNKRNLGELDFLWHKNSVSRLRADCIERSQVLFGYDLAGTFWFLFSELWSCRLLKFSY